MTETTTKKQRKRRKSHVVSAEARARMSAASVKKWRESVVMGSPAYCAAMRTSLLNSASHAAAMARMKADGSASARAKRAWRTRRRNARAEAKGIAK